MHVRVAIGVRRQQKAFGLEIKAHCFMGLYLSQEAHSVILMKRDLSRLLNLLLLKYVAGVTPLSRFKHMTCCRDIDMPSLKSNIFYPSIQTHHLTWGILEGMLFLCMVHRSVSQSLA